jgi:hypothetical protein
VLLTYKVSQYGRAHSFRQRDRMQLNPSVHVTAPSCY